MMGFKDDKIRPEMGAQTVHPGSIGERMAGESREDCVQRKAEELVSRQRMDWDRAWEMAKTLCQYPTTEQQKNNEISGSIRSVRGDFTIEELCTLERFFANCLSVFESDGGDPEDSLIKETIKGLRKSYPDKSYKELKGMAIARHKNTGLLEQKRNHIEPKD